MECGTLLPGVHIVIANPETKGQCADARLGEIWVSSAHNAAGYFSLFAEDAHLHTDHFNARLTTGDTKTGNFCPEIFGETIHNLMLKTSSF
jgi:acyl-CoA synthetase (AMP-forming)/AMP-acid ligase II